MERQIVERNLRYLVIEIFWAAIFTGCVSFNSAYLIHLGGSNLLVSLLPAGSALVNALTTMPFAALLERVANRRWLIVGSLGAMRIGHLGLIALPWLGGWRAETMVVLLLLLNVPVALFTAGWLPLLAEIIPYRRRAKIFAARNLTLGATVTVATFFLGFGLDRIPFPLNYQLLYLVAVITSSVSTVYVARLAMPPAPERPAMLAPMRLSLAGLRQTMQQKRAFTNIVLNTLVFNMALWMAVPLQPIYFVRTLGASDGWLGLWTGLVSAGAIVGNLMWGYIIERRGSRWTLLRAAALGSIYYFLIGLFPDLTLILIFALVSGLTTAGFDLSQLNLLYEVCPEERRSSYMGMYTTVVQFGACIAPLLVPPLSDLVGTRGLVLGLGLIRVVAALLFVFNPVNASAPPAEAT